jgi:DNA-binding MarR family transcriptional regulator
MKRPAVFQLPAQADDLDSRIVAAAERLGTALESLLRGASRADGLSPLQGRVLVLLLQRGHDAPRSGALARAFDVTPPTISDALAALAAKGLVRREPAAGHDARSVASRLTPRGRAVARRLATWADPARALVGGSSEDRVRTLGVLMTWIAALQRGGLVSVARMCLTCRFFRREAHRGAVAPHHCALLDVPLGDETLRVDCPEHEAA